MILQATPAEKIEQLEAMKAKLLVQRAELQSKIERLTTTSPSSSPEAQESLGQT